MAISEKQSKAFILNTWKLPYVTSNPSIQVRFAHYAVKKISNNTKQNTTKHRLGCLTTNLIDPTT
jgi:hypothetical protein